MKGQKEIILSGVGGQGMILCGTMIAESAVLHDGKIATLSSEYGTETRGTFAKSDVIVSDGPIYFPDVTQPDLVVCLHQVAYERYSGKVSGNCLLLYDSETVRPRDGAAGEKGVAVSQMALQAGNLMTANIITLGIILGYLPVAAPEGVRETIRRFFRKKSEKIIEMNYRAFEAGLVCGAGLR